jgi:hypothetical protein
LYMMIFYKYIGIFGPILNLAGQKVSIQEYIFFSILKR